MAAKLARKAPAPDAAPDAAPDPTPAPAASLRGPSGSLDPLILALTRAVDRQAPARPSSLRDSRTD